MTDCASCKWWTESDYPTPDPWQYGVTVELVQARPDLKWGECTALPSTAIDAMGDEEHTFKPNSRAYTYDASEYSSGLNTRADFGCVEWENK